MSETDQPTKEATREPIPPVEVEPGAEYGIDLETALDGEARGWNPEPGEKLIGRVLFVSTCDCGGFGEHALIEVVQDDGQVLDVHGFHQVLARAIERWKPRPGSRIGIKYFGRLEGVGDFGGYENYRVVVQQ